MSKDPVKLDDVAFLAVQNTENTATLAHQLIAMRDMMLALIRDMAAADPDIARRIANLAAPDLAERDPRIGDVAREFLSALTAQDGACTEKVH